MKTLLALLIWGFNPNPDTTWNIDTSSNWGKLYSYFLESHDTTEARNLTENTRLAHAIDKLAQLRGFAEQSIDRQILHEQYYERLEVWPEGRYETEAQYDYLIENTWVFFRILREEIEHQVDMIKHLNWIDPDKSKRIPSTEFEAKLDAVLQKHGLTV